MIRLARKPVISAASPTISHTLTRRRRFGFVLRLDALRFRGVPNSTPRAQPSAPFRCYPTATPNKITPHADPFASAKKRRIDLPSMRRR